MTENVFLKCRLICGKKGKRFPFHRSGDNSLLLLGHDHENAYFEGTKWNQTLSNRHRVSFRVLKFYTFILSVSSLVIVHSRD